MRQNSLHIAAGKHHFPIRSITYRVPKKRVLANMDVMDWMDGCLLLKLYTFYIQFVYVLNINFFDKSFERASAKERFFRQFITMSIKAL